MSLSTHQLKALIMSQIQHDDEYYKQAMASIGFVVKNLTHIEIALFKAEMLGIEADTILHVAETQNRSLFSYMIDNLIAKKTETGCVHPYASIHRRGEIETCLACGKVLCEG